MTAYIICRNENDSAVNSDTDIKETQKRISRDPRLNKRADLAPKNSDPRTSLARQGGSGLKNWKKAMSAKYDESVQEQQNRQMQTQSCQIQTQNCQIQPKNCQIQPKKCEIQTQDGQIQTFPFSIENMIVLDEISQNSKEGERKEDINFLKYPAYPSGLKFFLKFILTFMNLTLKTFYQKFFSLGMNGLKIHPSLPNLVQNVLMFTISKIFSFGLLTGTGRVLLK